MLKELHWEHPGTCAMKAIARTCVWWPNMDEEIEKKVKFRTVCQNVRSSPPSAPLIPWKWATRPFQRIHIDKHKQASLEAGSEVESREDKQEHLRNHYSLRPRCSCVPERLTDHKCRVTEEHMKIYFTHTIASKLLLVFMPAAVILSRFKG